MNKRKISTAATTNDKRSSVRLRHALLVLGMHRAGTSALSGVLAKLGATPPRSLMASNEFNPRGYWESTELVILHDSILQSAGSRWSDWGRFNQGWFDSPVSPEFEERLEAVIAREYGDSSFFSVKDPRMSRFLPLWLRVLGKLNITPKAIVPVRHPEEVVRSLERRDHFGRSKGLLLWLRHVLDAELASRHLNRAFLRYEDLLEDWQSQMRRVGQALEITWPRWSADTEAAITDFLSSELRHHRIGEVRNTGSGELGEWAGRVYAVIDGFAQGEPQNAGAFGILDSVRQELDRTSEVYCPVVREQELSAKKEYSEMKAHMRDEIEVARQEALASNAALADMERRALRAESDAKSRAGRLLVLQTDFDKLESRMLEQADRYRQLEAEMQARLQAELVALRSDADSCNERLAALQRDNSKLEASMAEQAELHRKVEAELKSQCELLESEREQLSTSLSERFRELAAFAKRMEAQRKEHSEMTSRLSCLQLERDELTGARQELGRTQRMLGEAMSRLERAGAERDAMERQIGVLSSELSAANDKLDGVLNSNTWKVGRPFRVLRRMLKGSRAEQQVTSVEDIERIRSSGVFDETWYLERYPDVAALKMDAIYHYMSHGCNEGRDPSPEFSTSDYYKSHPEIADGKHNALLHFLDHGA